MTTELRQYITDYSFLSVASIILVMTAGTMFLMWIGELIQEYGLGNGISLIIFAGIVARFLPGLYRSS